MTVVVINQFRAFYRIGDANGVNWEKNQLAAVQAGRKQRLDRVVRLATRLDVIGT